MEPVDADTLRTAVIDAMVRVREESGIQFEDEIGFRQTKNGFKATTRFRILHRGQTSPIKIDLDLTGTDSEQSFSQSAIARSSITIPTGLKCP